MKACGKRFCNFSVALLVLAAMSGCSHIVQKGGGITAQMEIAFTNCLDFISRLDDSLIEEPQIIVITYLNDARDGRVQMMFYDLEYRDSNESFVPSVACAVDTSLVVSSVMKYGRYVLFETSPRPAIPTHVIHSSGGRRSAFLRQGRSLIECASGPVDSIAVNPGSCLNELESN